MISDDLEKKKRQTIVARTRVKSLLLFMLAYLTEKVSEKGFIVDLPTKLFSINLEGQKPGIASSSVNHVRTIYINAISLLDHELLMN